MTIDGSRLKIDLSEGTRWRRTLHVTVPGDIVEEAQRRAARELAGRMKPPPGFRKGRVPLSLVEKQYGPALRRETLDRVIGDAYREALKRRSLRPISQGEVDEVDYDGGEDLTFQVSFDVEPQVELARLGGFQIERPRVEPGDEEVEKVLQRVREQQGIWRPEETGPPTEGDSVAVEIERREEGGGWSEARSYEFVLGQGEAIPDVEKAIASLEPGSSGEFRATFPDDFPDAEQRGETEELRISLKARKVRELPELDDEFARQAGDFEDLEALRARIREDLEKEARDEAEAQVRRRLLDALVEANPFEVPRSMVGQYVDSVLGDQKDELPEDRLAEIRSSLEPEAERAVRRFLMVERIASTQGLQSTQDEVDRRIEEIAERNDTTPQEVYGRLQKAGRLESLERELTESKVFEFLKEKSTIKDAS